MVPLPKRVNKRCPRRNLPKDVGRKRGESAFVLAFNRAFQEQLRGETEAFLCARELPVAGYGIADFVCLRRPAFETDDGQTETVLLLSFEMKLKGWKKGFAQACRYLFFSHSSILVLPPEEAKLASEKLDLFKKTKVGLLSFDAATSAISNIYWPAESPPRSSRAYQKALGKVSSAFPDRSKGLLETHEARHKPLKM